MANQTRTSVNQKNYPHITWHGAVNHEQHKARIREAAYHHYAMRGYTHAHELEDWFLAKAIETFLINLALSESCKNFLKLTTDNGRRSL